MRFLLGRCCCTTGGGGGPTEPCAFCLSCDGDVPCQFSATITNTSLGPVCDFPVGSEDCNIAGTYLLDYVENGWAGEPLPGGVYEYTWCRWKYFFPWYLASEPAGCRPRDLTLDIDVFRPSFAAEHTLQITLSMGWGILSQLSWRKQVVGGADPDCTLLTGVILPINESELWPWDPDMHFFCQDFTEEAATISAVPIP